MTHGPLNIVMQGALVALVLYLLMKYILGQSDSKALTRSVLLGLLVAAYMIIFGCGLPNKINSNL